MYVTLTLISNTSSEPCTLKDFKNAKIEINNFLMDQFYRDLANMSAKHDLNFISK